MWRPTEWRSNSILFQLALVRVGRALDAFVSVGVIGINSAISVAREIRPTHILDRLAVLNRPTTTVIRGRQERVPVPGDLVVGPGDQIILDGRLLDGRCRSINRC